MVSAAPILPLQDFQCISNAVAGMIIAEEASVIGKCVLFGLMGARVLRTSYKLADARAVVGAFYLRLESPNVIAFAGYQGTESNRQNFHCWVEAAGYIFDFSSFTYRDLARQSFGVDCATLMFQKHGSRAVPTPNALRKPGDFYVLEDRSLREKTIDATLSYPAVEDILEILEHWYQPPPKKMQRIGLADAKGKAKPVHMHNAVLQGAW